MKTANKIIDGMTKPEGMKAYDSPKKKKQDNPQGNCRKSAQERQDSNMNLKNMNGSKVIHDQLICRT